MQIMSLDLKDKTKKGYFGKVSGAGDFNKFYEGEFLLNKFNDKQKISVFALGSNTPHSSFSFSEQQKYGMIDESFYSYTEDGGDYEYWDFVQ